MNDHERWNLPPPGLKLKNNEVHVWKTSLEPLTEDIEHLQRILSDEECERAKRFYFEKDRRRWVVAHAYLRIVLGRYLDMHPDQLRFITNEYGKPSLLYPPSGARLHFNLSHSGELALYAFAYDRQVGIDIEYMRADLNLSELVTHHFSAYERSAFSALPQTLQTEAFYLCWARKEAYIKARGKGLAIPLDQFDVSLVPGEPAALLHSREEPEINKRWVLHALSPQVRYAAALVVEGFDCQLRCWQL